MNEKEKMCPILSVTVGGQPCERENCAWWDTDRQKCAIAVTPPRK